MIKDRKLAHIGLAVTDIDAAVQWYTQVLGVQVIGDFHALNGMPVRFLKNGDLVYEILQPPAGPAAPGKIDHIALQSSDIEADFAYCVAQGYTFQTQGIQESPTFWEKGARFFKLLTPTGEAVEFTQIL